MRVEAAAKLLTTERDTPEEKITKSNRMSYDKFYLFYDMVMGNRSDAANYIANLIAHHKPGAKTVLEIACGTGSILRILSASSDVTGLDLSRPMLAIARKKLPQVRFVRQDMISFHIARRFDAVVAYSTRSIPCYASRIGTNSFDALRCI